MTTIEEVTMMLPVLTPYHMPKDPEASALYNLADSIISASARGTAAGPQETQAYCYYIAYLMSSQEGKTGITSEHLGSYSVSYGDDTNPWLKLYMSTVRGGTFGGFASCTGVHNDAKTMQKYSIDDAKVTWSDL